MTINQLKEQDKKYFAKRAKQFRTITRRWKWCIYQGCNECIGNNGLVPPAHEFAGSLGPKDCRAV